MDEENQGRGLEITSINYHLKGWAIILLPAACSLDVVIDILETQREIMKGLLGHLILKVRSSSLYYENVDILRFPDLLDCVMLFNLLSSGLHACLPTPWKAQFEVEGGVSVSSHCGVSLGQDNSVASRARSGSCVPQLSQSCSFLDGLSWLGACGFAVRV